MSAQPAPTPAPPLAPNPAPPPRRRAGGLSQAPPGGTALFAARWLTLLAGVLMGLALLGRTFAYLGLPPLFISELTIIAGLGLLLFLPGATAALGTPTLGLALVLLAVVALRTVPYIGTYGFDALRDAVLGGYAVLAIVVAAVLLSSPNLLPWLIRGYRRFARLFLCVLPALWLLSVAGGDALPTLPWAPDVNTLELKSGDLAIHLGAIAAMTVLGLSRLHAWYYTALLCVLLGVTGAVSRGGLVGFMLMFGTAFCLRPKSPWAGRLIIAVLAVLSLAALVNLEVEVPGRERSFSAQQIVTNLISVVSDDTDAGDLGDTKAWRLNWWSKIVDYTLFGDYFWTGRGFGVNLANVDGFQTEHADDGLRAPHNGHLSFLARGGVPAFAVWCLLQVAWLYAVTNGYYRARRLGDAGWAMTFGLLFCYWLGIMWNASFDVYLEGPMGGLWYWTVIGVGVAAARLQVTHPQLLRHADFMPR